jgi:adenosylcobinamide-GDP ribazoletransferase
MKDEIKPLRGLHLAHTFLTTLPLPHVGEVREGEFRYASGFYPAVGWTLGALLVFTAWITAGLPSGVGAALTLAVWLGLSGMLHFDGLVDSADAILAAKSPQKRLEILGDIHIGAFGLAVGVVSLLLKWSALGAHPGTLGLLVAPVLARAAVLFPMNFFPAARPESLGARSREGNWPIGLVFAVPAALISPIAALVAVMTAFAVAFFAARRLGGGISGDVYGAIIELTEITVLIAVLATRSS